MRIERRGEIESEMSRGKQMICIYVQTDGARRESMIFVQSIKSIIYGE